jgi:hypothetical protein
VTRVARQERLTIVPLILDEARDVVAALHRHHKKPTGHRFSIGVQRPDGSLCGVAIVGRPVARAFANRYTAEVTRVATDGTPNACSALYGAVWGAASRMGFLRVITYTQDGESGASLRAVGWKPIAVLRPRTGWDTPSRRREDRGADGVARILWEQRAKGAPELPPIDVLRHEMRHEIPCLACGEYFALKAGPGRPAAHCSDTCRKRTSRRRAAQRAAQTT